MGRAGLVGIAGVVGRSGGKGRELYFNNNKKYLKSRNMLVKKNT